MQGIVFKIAADWSIDWLFV